MVEALYALKHSCSLHYPHQEQLWLQLFGAMNPRKAIKVCLLFLSQAAIESIISQYQACSILTRIYMREECITIPNDGTHDIPRRTT